MSGGLAGTGTNPGTPYSSTGRKNRGKPGIRHQFFFYCQIRSSGREDKSRGLGMGTPKAPTILDRAKTALRDACNNYRGGSVQFHTASKSLYVQNLDDNFLWGLRLGNQATAYSPDEIYKMHATHSSATMIFNIFGPWAPAGGSGLVIGGRYDFVKVGFEVRLDPGLGTEPPHLDAVLEWRCNGGRKGIMGVEGKLTEHIRATSRVNPSRPISPTYRNIAGFSQLEPILVSRDWHHLDVAQLVKHILGLEFIGRNKKFNQVVLLYLYWEPLNRPLLQPFETHRDEIDLFRNQYQNTIWSERVIFEPVALPDLVGQWDASRNGMSPTISQYVGQHLRGLEGRYLIQI